MKSLPKKLTQLAPHPMVCVWGLLYHFPIELDWLGGLVGGAALLDTFEELHRGQGLLGMIGQDKNFDAASRKSL